MIASGLGVFVGFLFCFGLFVSFSKMPSCISYRTVMNSLAMNTSMPLCATDAGLWLQSQIEVSGTQTNRGGPSQPSPSSSRAKKGQCHQLWVLSATPPRLPTAIWEGDWILEIVASLLASGARWGTGQSDSDSPSTAPP